MRLDHTMFDHLVDPMFVIDQRGEVLYANPAACSLFGWEREELVGGPITRLMAEPYRSEHDGYLRHYLETGETKAIGRVRKVLGRNRRGVDFPCELSVSFATVDGEPRFYGIVRDMTEREQMVARLAQVERLAAMGELAAGIAHEVNNPVNTIINCAQLLKDGEDDPSLLDDVVQEGMRIAMIVRDLLDFAADRTDRFTEVDVGQVISRVLNLVSRRLERQGIRLVAELAPDLPYVSGAAHQIQQVLLNVVLNARDALIDAGTDAPEIRVSTAFDEAGKRVRVAVTDNGPGIDPTEHERIFEPFFSKKHNKGTGLGLAVSRGIVNDHGGELTVASALGGPTTFEFWIAVSDGPGA